MPENHPVVLHSRDRDDLRQAAEQLAHIEGGWKPTSNGAKVLHRITNAPRLVLWGSDCLACEGYTTPFSMHCDECGSDEHTVALWRCEPAQEPPPAARGGAS